MTAVAAQMGVAPGAKASVRRLARGKRRPKASAKPAMARDSDSDYA